MIMLTRQTKFILAIALQVVIIFTIIIFKVSILSGGTSILLRVKPVDSRDPLRGDYATFKYSDISNPDLYIPSRKKIRNGDTVYVVLRRVEKYWTAENIQKTKPSGGKLYIKGKVISGGIENQSVIFSNQRFYGTHVHVVYGIEQYFIPEGKGQGLSFWNKEAVAKVVIDENGNAVLKQIYVEGNPWP